MKAYVLHGINDLRWEERPVPKPAPGWALVRVRAAGICSSDIPRIFEKGTYRFPTIPGHEFCGVVESTGTPEDQIWVGKRVGVFPLIPCGKCASCQKGEYETCESYDYIGSRRDGAFAEYVAAPVWNLIELPEAVPDTAAAMLEPAAVALHAVRRLGGLAGKTVCVVGTGAIGFLAGQWARLLGGEAVTIKGRGLEKAPLAQACGLLYSQSPSSPFDCVVEAVGSPQAIEESIQLTAPGGRLVLMGNPSGAIPLAQNVYWRLLRKQITATGSWNSSFGGEDSDWARTLGAMERGALRTGELVSHILPGDQLEKGLSIMGTRTEAFCKIEINFSVGVK